MMENIKDDHIHSLNVLADHKDGTYKYVQISIARVEEEGRITFVVAFRDVHEIMQRVIETRNAKKHLEQLVREDDMTHLGNRRAFDEFMESQTELQDDFVFMSLDLNELKSTNDTLGHNAGDELIIGTSTVLQNTLGQYGSVYRTGGDEFIALVNIPLSVRQSVFDELEKSFKDFEGKLVKELHVSLGYCSKDEAITNKLSEMQRIAEQRMYAEKAEYYLMTGHDRRKFTL